MDRSRRLPGSGRRHGRLRCVARYALVCTGIVAIAASVASSFVIARSAMTNAQHLHQDAAQVSGFGRVGGSCTGSASGNGARGAILPQRSVLARPALGAPSLLAACTLPTLLGLWRSEYGVSYGYGGAVAASGFLMLKVAASSTPIFAQAFCLVLYGLRLSAYLLYRELCIPKFRDFRERIEERARQRGARLKRLPFVLSCALLYLGLAAPALLALRSYAVRPSLGDPRSGLLAMLFQVLIVGMYSGWAVAALGDTYKSWHKATEGEGKVVTSGIFSLMRHPNYTGEQFLWTFNFLAGVVAVISGGAPMWSASTAGWLTISALGVLGINFVLMQATGGLQARQAAAYAGDEAYEKWVARAWSGFPLSRTQASTAEGKASGDVKVASAEDELKLDGACRVRASAQQMRTAVQDRT
eukprot:CAMPEP_0204128324 /NCGR_PEP_ID=MMETSP0361-20130328/12116_1 /ASSEMBLY_ACC=CAM_ASM_000343 /TAXON_ID=268821 /ORGANISM="Scrippsiella Hangoei, Strain SHTV-5" /LENGTH=413 /DNA_ID=CAMNT_0051080535 /DNA_START=38 /DNA_END=1277 /DNA_ORIENTATION=+